MKSLLLFNLVIFVALSSVSAYHILCVFVAPSKSHTYLGKGIVDALLDGGHQVTWVTPFPGKGRKNLRQIEVPKARELLTNVNVTSALPTSLFRQLGRSITLSAITTEEVKKAVVKEQYDAVISEWVFSDIEAGYAAVQQVPWILLNGLVMHPYMEYLVDTVRSLPVVPFMLSDSPIPMSFWQRLVNTFIFGALYLSTWMDHSQTVSLYKEHFGPIASARGVTLPPFSEALHNISIMFVNSHPSFAPALSLPPNVVEIAGYHISDQIPPLPKDLQDLLDSSTEGVVYFSMGSVVKSSSFPELTKRELIKVFSELPYTVLWKFEEKLDDLPKNLHVRTWMPQASILAHRNVKVFITHGGMLSTLESIRFGIPVLAVPVYGDQPGNAARAVRTGYAQQVPFSVNMAPQIKTALNEMLSNDSYFKRAKVLSKLFNNRPVSQRKLISHYVEVAIESKGAFHLRSKSLLYEWYQLWMLDQAAALAAVLVLLYMLLKRIFTTLSKRLVQVDQEKEKKK